MAKKKDKGKTKTAKPKAKAGKKPQKVIEDLKIKVIGYCVKCKEKKQIKDPQLVEMATGRLATKGSCKTCGTGMFRTGDPR